MANRFIEKLQSFGRLTREETAALREATSVNSEVAARKDLIREGDRPGPVFVILEGWACRYKILPSGTRQILAYLMPGDSCDLNISLLAQMDHSIQTITDCCVATVERPVFVDLMKRDGIAHVLYISQLIDEGTMRAWITSMGRRTSVERVAHLMCELYIRARNVGLTDKPEFDLPLSQSLLADSLGMTSVHLNRVLKTLRASGAMTLTRGNLLITDPDKLVRIAGFDDSYLHRMIRRAA